MDEENKTTLSFDNLNLKDNLLRGIYSYGFENPSKIQHMAIPHIIAGKDLIAQAHSGTGKTGAFTIGCLQKLDENYPYKQSSDSVGCLIYSNFINGFFCTE